MLAFKRLFMSSWLEVVALLCPSFLLSIRAIYPSLVVADKVESVSLSIRGLSL